MADTENMVRSFPSNRKLKRLNNRQKKKIYCAPHTHYMAEIEIYLKEPIALEDIDQTEFIEAGIEPSQQDINLDWILDVLYSVNDCFYMVSGPSDSKTLKGILLGPLTVKNSRESLTEYLEALRKQPKIERMEVSIFDAVYDDKKTGESYVYEKFTM